MAALRVRDAGLLCRPRHEQSRSEVSQRAVKLLVGMPLRAPWPTLRTTGNNRSPIFPRQLERIFARGAAFLLRALPDHAGKALQRHQRLAGIGPFLQFLDCDVIERLAT